MTLDMDELLNTYVALYRHEVRQVPEAKGRLKWFVLADDGNWKRDTTLRARWYARLVCRDASQRVSKETGNNALARSIATATTVSRLERLARSDPRLIGELPARAPVRPARSDITAQESVGRV
jgi:hypothetical protein